MGSPVRRSMGFRRYAFSVQYHGSSFLGFTYQGDQEDSIHGRTDLRGYRSVESCLTESLTCLFGRDGWENFQVSSRTDRGVHALKNTCHVDIRNLSWPCDRLHRGLNFHIRRQEPWFQRDRSKPGKRQRLGNRWERFDPMNELRVLQVKEAPLFMVNDWADRDPTQPATIDWHVRFSATERTYLYRILHSYNDEFDWAAPFEWDRSWRIHRSRAPLNVTAMQEAAQFLVGQHNFESFRGKGCQRNDPVVTLRDVSVEEHPYTDTSCLGLLPSDLHPRDCKLLTLRFRGNAFLYRQVRNVTGCLVEVGRENILPGDIPSILEARSRAAAPAMAPAHGLFLVEVKHGDFDL